VERIEMFLRPGCFQVGISQARHGA
jgi:hypothetical protein